MEQLKELYEKIDSKVPILIILIMLVLCGDSYLIMGIFDSFSKMNNFLRVPPPPKPEPFEPSEIPPIEKFNIEEMKEIPREYQIIVDNNIYVNPELRELSNDEAAPPIQANASLLVDAGSDTDTSKSKIINLRERLLQQTQSRTITGYHVVGIVKNAYNKLGVSAVLLENSSGQKFYGREGEKIKNSQITVKKVYDDRLILSKPGFIDTVIPFEKERLLLKWKDKKQKTDEINTETERDLN
jgi:hypothetical protein